MKLAMYKGPPTELVHTISHEGICLVTGSDYSHAELVFGELDRHGKCLCASASARDHGVRFKNIDLVTSGRWDLYPIKGDEAAAYRWFTEHQGAGYDYFGLGWFILPIDQINDPKRYFCSEAIAAALGYARPLKFHPQRLLDHALKVPHEYRP